MKALIADDSASIRTLLKHTLTKMGYEVTECSNGMDVWKLIKKGIHFNIFILDWIMPGLSGVELCKKYKENATVINAVESHHGDVEATSLIACIVQAADTISAARPGARRETLETYTSRLKQLEEITNNFKGVDKSFAIQAGREVRVMVVPEQITDADMVLLARDISKQIEADLEYPGQIKVNVIRESRVVDYAK